MTNSINLNHELTIAREANEQIKSVCSSLKKENDVLRKIVAEEITKRLELEALNDRYASIIKQRGAVLNDIRRHLDDASRKEELVKLIRTSISKIDF
jgi:hypothetical protein